MYSVLSLFPELFIFSFLAPTILRIGASIIIFRGGLAHYRQFREIEPALKGIAAVEVVGAVALFFGAYTQAAAILLIVAFIGRSLKLWNGFSKSERELTVILSFILLSLIITGPGALAIDLPL